MYSIDFGEFLMVIKEQKAATAAAGDEGDTILAFVALGGKPDKTGIISAEKLRQTCKVGARLLRRGAVSGSRTGCEPAELCSRSWVCVRCRILG